MTGPEFSQDFCNRLDDLFVWRRDVRQFRSDPLPDGAVDELLDIACHGPSVGNAQPWRFVRVLSPELRAALTAHADTQKRVASTAYAGSQKTRYDGLKLHGLREAPEVLAVFCDEQARAGHGLGRATMPETLCWSVVAAINSLWLAARAQGIGMGWVSILDPTTLNALLDVPAGWRFVALLCLGFPADESDTPELVRHDWQDRLPASHTRFKR
jgi:5,6-dimethylbenzimidazole synthase